MPPARARVTAPNVLFILADDLGWADLGCYGSDTISTPNLDRLAAHGVRFTHAYAGSPWCSPTRISLYTGRFPGRLAAGAVVRDFNRFLVDTVRKFTGFAILYGEDDVQAAFTGDGTLTRTMSWRDYAGQGGADVRALHDAAATALAIEIGPLIARGWTLANT